MLNIVKKIIIVYLILNIVKKKYFNNINGFTRKNILYLVKIKNKKIKKIKIFNKIIIYFGYIFCYKKCPKIIRSIKNIKNYKNKFIFLSINKNENTHIIEKFLSKIKLNNIYGLNNTEKKIDKISKNFKLIYKYKKEIINHNDTLYKIKKNNFLKWKKK